nr:hypothetical protein [Sphingomonas sp. J315]
MRDTALLPVQLEGLDALIPDLTLVEVDAGHFVPWEKPQPVTDAIGSGWRTNPPGPEVASHR